MDCHTLNILSLCSGVGGLDLGVELATGGAARVVCHVEREAFAAAVLAARMEEEAVAAAPVWSDLRTFDGRPWRGVVDCITGGYPCQPFSFAGERRGADDPRHLWPSIARIVEETQPTLCFFENVGGHLSLGFESVRDDLQAMGYRVAAGLFSAAEVGAPHRRERLFILAHREGGGCGELRSASGGDGRAEQDGGDVADRSSCRRQTDYAEGPRQVFADGGGGRVVNAAHLGHQRSGQAWDGRGGSADAGGELADAHGAGREGCGLGERKHGEPGPRGEGLADAGSQRPQGLCEGRPAAGATGRGDGAAIPLFPPGPGNRIEWERILRARPDLAPAVEPRVRGVADGASAGVGGFRASRLDQLQALGNAVVPLQAAKAFVTLWACIQNEPQRS